MGYHNNITTKPNIDGHLQITNNFQFIVKLIPIV
jgi:hypothetical protein